jgi:hypothetical protein
LVGAEDPGARHDGSCHRPVVPCWKPGVLAERGGDLAACALVAGDLDGAARIGRPVTRSTVSVTTAKLPSTDLPIS